MSWNHRVIQKKDKSGNLYFEIHEAYYNDEHELCALTETAVSPCGNSVEDLKLSIKMMATAFEKPVLLENEIEYGEWN
jgi:hypothetical protein